MDILKNPLIILAEVDISIDEAIASGFSFPGTQPGDLTLPLQTSVDCDICHSEPIYDRWRGSLMSQSGRDPLMWAVLHAANNDAPNAGEYCLRCHTPKGWYDGRSHRPDGSALQGEDINRGVAYALCHRMVDPVVSTTIDEAYTIDEAIRATLAEPIPTDFQGSGAIIVDPEDHRRGPFSFGGALPYHSSYQTDFLNQTGLALTRSRFYGSCHHVYNPILSWDPLRGESFHFLLNNTVVKDNRIPPQGYTVAQYDRPGLRPVGAAYQDGQSWDETQYLLPESTDLVHALLYY